MRYSVPLSPDSLKISFFRVWPQGCLANFFSVPLLMLLRSKTRAPSKITSGKVTRSRKYPVLKLQYQLNAKRSEKNYTLLEFLYKI